MAQKGRGKVDGNHTTESPQQFQGICQQAEIAGHSVGRAALEVPGALGSPGELRNRHYMEVTRNEVSLGCLLAFCHPGPLHWATVLFSLNFFRDSILLNWQIPILGSQNAGVTSMCHHTVQGYVLQGLKCHIEVELNLQATGSLWKNLEIKKGSVEA